MPYQKFGEFISYPFKLGSEHSALRYLFVKQHAGKDDLKPSNRTLYAINVPQQLSKKSVDFLFKDYGEIEHIYIHKKPTSEEKVSPSGTSKYFSIKVPESKLGCKVAYIVFKKSFCLRKVLKAKNAANVTVIPLSKVRPHVGKMKWIREYNAQFVDSNFLQKEIEKYMSEYDKKVEGEKQKAKETDGVPDEEGWITVTKHSRKPKIPRSEAVSKKIIEKQNKDRTKKTLLNFYRCQLREAKMEHIAELRKKFEKDKERVALMKANRKFKPF